MIKSFFTLGFTVFCVCGINAKIFRGRFVCVIICFCVELARETFLYGYMFQVLLNFITVLPKFLLRYFAMTIVPCLSLPANEDGCSDQTRPGQVTTFSSSSYSSASTSREHHRLALGSNRARFTAWCLLEVCPVSHFYPIKTPGVVSFQRPVRVFGGPSWLIAA